MMNDIKFDYDDILLVPNQLTNIKSRFNDIELPNMLPIFTAPMDTVVDIKNSTTFIDHGINVCMPRTVSKKDFIIEFLILSEINFRLTTNNIINYNDNIIPSVGLIDAMDPKFISLSKHMLIDVANGHMEDIMVLCNRIKEYNPSIKIIVGNIANPKTYELYARKGCVDYIRCGIGNGSGCLTTQQTSIGYPNASLIHEIRKIKEKLENEGIDTPKIIADGGFKNYSDIIKALALGADYVMLGSLLNKTIESCAPSYLWGVKLNSKIATELFKRGFPIKKYFRGMSTKEAQKAMGKNNTKTSEGVIRYQKVEYTLKGWVENFNHYLRSAMSYSGAKKLDEFIGKAEFCLITKNAHERFKK